MKRIFLLLGGVLLVQMLVMAALLFLNGRRLPAWQEELDRYVQYRAGRSQATISLIESDRAARPWNFSSEMSAKVYGSTVYYQVNSDYSYTTPEPTEEGGMNYPDTGRVPLPFPANDMYCARLDVAGEQQIVLIAQQSDLYGAGWFVHEPPNDQITAILEDLGCTLDQ